MGLEAAHGVDLERVRASKEFRVLMGYLRRQSPGTSKQDSA